jgi:hypothetical protein
VDTGANKNYISPRHVNPENCKIENGIQVTNIRGKHKIEKSASFDVFQIKKKVKFFVFDFHDFFDGLIGYETLRDLNAKLDIGKNTLKVGRKTFQMEKKFSEGHKINISEHEFQMIKIRTEQNGDFLIEDEKPHENFTVLPGLYKSSNNEAFIAVQNFTKSALEINSNEIIIKNNYYEHIDLTKQSMQNAEQDQDPFDLVELPKKIDLSTYTIRDCHMNKEEKQALRTVIEQNEEILYVETDKLSFTHRIKHNIRTTDNIPVHSKSYKYPYVYENEVQKQVKKMLTDGIIKESISPYTSPVWVVPKKSDASGQKKFRLVIDYRKLNEKTINDKYPIPEITDILDKLGRAKYFSTIDLVSGFHQIQLADEDTEKRLFQ